MSILGQGTYGTVYTYPKDPRYAKKVFRKCNHCIAEWVVTSVIKHPNVIKYESVDLDEKAIYMKRYQHSLESWISSGRITNEDKQFIVKSIMNGLCYMHYNGISHSDITPSNILLNVDKKTKAVKEVVICDLGLSNINNYNTGQYTSYLFRDPKNGKDFLHDIYSTGVVILRLFINNDEWKNIFMPLRNSRPSLDNLFQYIRTYIVGLPRNIKKVVAAMTSQDLTERPSIRQAMGMLGFTPTHITRAFSTVNISDIGAINGRIRDYFSARKKDIPRQKLLSFCLSLYIEKYGDPGKETKNYYLAASYIMCSVYRKKNIAESQISDDVKEAVKIMVCQTNFITGILTPSSLIK